MKLYIAGPDVFRPDFKHWASTVQATCRRAGYEALIPFDDAGSSADAIFKGNLRLIDEADALVANLNPFRGTEPDSGTCVEVGYAIARGTPVFGYAESLAPLRQRLGADALEAGQPGRDASGWLIEDFGLPLNLMLAVPAQLVEGDIDACLIQVFARWAKT